MFDIYCSCSFGLESVLKKEIRKLGLEISSVTDGAVQTKGNAADIAKLNICLRTCNRVFIRMGEYEAGSFDELFEAVNAVDWETVLPHNAKFDVTKISCVKSRIMSKSDSQRIIKKAIVERLKLKYKTSVLKENGAYYQIHVKIRKDKVLLLLNTSGESLHKRGYRSIQTKAPVKETLAAGIILLSGYDGSQPFADFMCGSGTIIIEAALIASKTAPNLNRSFAFENWDMITPNMIMDIKSQIGSINKIPSFRLLGSDIDKNAVKAANTNAKIACVENITAFQKLDFRNFSSGKKHGIIIVNPPYGERMDLDKTNTLYKDMRKIYESLDEWKMFVLCGNEEFERYYGKRANKNRKLYNGKLLTYLYQYF